MFPGLNLYCTDPALHLVIEGYNISNISDLSVDLSVWRVNYICRLSPLLRCSFFGLELSICGVPTYSSSPLRENYSGVRRVRSDPRHMSAKQNIVRYPLTKAILHVISITVLCLPL